MLVARPQQLLQRCGRLVPALLVLPAQPAVPAVPGEDLHALRERQDTGAERDRGGVLGRGDVLYLDVSEVRGEGRVGLGGLLAAEPGVHDVPERADLTVA